MQLGNFQKTFKTLGLVFGLMVVLGITILLGQQASTFLAKASQCPAQNVKVVQVTANSAVVSWETADVSQGRVEYGTGPTQLTFSAPEATSGKTHNVPLTLLTPNTVYYYMVNIGSTRCDSSGQTCDNNCVPWSFTTSAIQPQEEIQKSLPTVTTAITTKPTRSATPTAQITSSPTTSQTAPTSTLSGFCTLVQSNIGASSRDASSWASVSQYDVDTNGVINGLDVIKCVQQGK